MYVCKPYFWSVQGLPHLGTGVFLLAGDLSGGLPGSNVTKDDLPDGPKPGQTLKDLPSGSAGSQVAGQVCRHARLPAAAECCCNLLTVTTGSGGAALHRVSCFGFDSQASWCKSHSFTREGPVGGAEECTKMHVLLCRWARLQAKAATWLTRLAVWLTRLAVPPRISRARTLSVSEVIGVIGSPAALLLPMYASLVFGVSQACMTSALAL